MDNKTYEMNLAPVNWHKFLRFTMDNLRIIEMLDLGVAHSEQNLGDE